MNFPAVFGSLTGFDKLIYGTVVVQDCPISFFLNINEICTLVIVLDYPSSQFVANLKLVCSGIMQCTNHTRRGKGICYIYHINNAIKLGKYNVGRESEVLTIPLYMGFLVKDTLADVIIPDVDLSLLT